MTKRRITKRDETGLPDAIEVEAVPVDANNIKPVARDASTSKEDDDSSPWRPEILCGTRSDGSLAFMLMDPVPETDEKKTALLECYRVLSAAQQHIVSLIAQE